MAIPSIRSYPMPAPDSFPANKVAWKLDPSRAALLIHDMQRYFLRFYETDSGLLQTLIGNIATLKRWAAAHGVPVFYTAQPHDQPASDRALLNDMWGPGLTKADPAQQAVVPEIAPVDGDVVLTK
ncbi:MAG: isochorismatase family protein, partial [Lautropia mirabilis]|nr:isochorismatase family protein [Lautropia mirabilis]